MRVTRATSPQGVIDRAAPAALALLPAPRGRLPVLPEPRAKVQHL